MPDASVPSSARVEIPRDYGSLCRLINENKKLILADWGLVLEILNALDNLLDEARCMSDLHRDTSIMLSTIRLQQEALVRAYQNNLTLEKLAELSNDGALAEFFELAKSKSLAVRFFDRLSFEYRHRERREPAERTRYDSAVGPASMPEQRDAGRTEDAQTRLMHKIRKTVAEAGMVEYFRLVMDPKSFSKTVYNSFSLALALRAKLVSLALIDGAVYVTPYAPGHADVGHSAVQLSPAQHALLVSKLGVDTALL
ncbi:hypothetical protein PAPHI01_0694 [Pancytospora philotis]|nr:hypothetical protein PAPHI01_0694 [Pancytospora philotis]